jgi:hypothetical protein
MHLIYGQAQQVWIWFGRPSTTDWLGVVAKEVLFLMEHHSSEGIDTLKGIAQEAIKKLTPYDPTEAGVTGTNLWALYISA